MAKTIVRECCVYWLFDETCSVPENDGYVGITTNLPQRLREHKSKGRFRWTGVEILFLGAAVECLEKEKGYRPYAGIGWNSNSGGTLGKTASAGTREKMSRWQKGSKHPDHGRKMKAIHAARSPEEKARLAAMYGRLALGNKSRVGQKRSAEECAGARARMWGNKYAVGNKNSVGHVVTKEHRENLSRRMKGNKLRFAAKLSDATKRKISASQKRRLAKRRAFPHQLSLSL
jgi:hypothetical protein